MGKRKKKGLHWVRQAPNCAETLLLQHVQNFKLLESFGYLSSSFRLSLNCIYEQKGHIRITETAVIASTVTKLFLLSYLVTSSTL